MTGLEVGAVVSCLAAVIGYLKRQAVAVALAIGLMAIGMLGSFVILGFDRAGLVDSAALQSFVSRIDLRTC